MLNEQCFHSRKNQLLAIICSWTRSIWFANFSSHWLKRSKRSKSKHTKYFPTFSIQSIFVTRSSAPRSQTQHSKTCSIQLPKLHLSYQPSVSAHFIEWCLLFLCECCVVAIFRYIFKLKEPESPEYGYNDIVKEHEAGYDSYMTGVCFIGLARKLNVNNADITAKSAHLRPFLNKWVSNRVRTVYRTQANSISVGLISFLFFRTRFFLFCSTSIGFLWCG